MPDNLSERLKTLLESYRPRMRDGGHPPELPDRILALVRDIPPGAAASAELKRLIDAAAQYWRLYDDNGADGGAPDPVDLEMVNDALIDALYDYYEA